MEWCNHELIFDHVDLDELEMTINSLPNKISKNKRFNLQVLRDAAEYVGYFLVTIINDSFTTGIFPTLWKESTVHPIPKVNNAKTAEQFRGINTLPIHEKIIESCVYRRLIDHIDKNNILMERQSGFRAKHSCETALNLIIDEWKLAMAKNKAVVAVFLDFKRAFETIDREILLSKLYYMGIRGTSHDWFKSYLERRTQRVKIDENTSDAKVINSGIPQGSALSAILFILYINDIDKILPIHCNLSLLADDTLMTATADTTT